MNHSLKILFIVALLIFNYFNGLSQMPTVHLTGLVRDKETKEAIPYAKAISYKVTDLGLVVGDTCHTDETGRYSFDLDTTFHVYKILGYASPEYWANEIEVKTFEAGDTLTRNINIEYELLLPYIDQIDPSKLSDSRLERFEEKLLEMYTSYFSAIRKEKKEIKKRRRKILREIRTARKTNRKKRQPKSTG